MTKHAKHSQSSGILHKWHTWKINIAQS